MGAVTPPADGNCFVLAHSHPQAVLAEGLKNPSTIKAFFQALLLAGVTVGGNTAATGFDCVVIATQLILQGLASGFQRQVPFIFQKPLAGSPKYKILCFNLSLGTGGQK